AALWPAPQCHTILLAGHPQSAQTSDIQVDKPVETCVQVNWQPETTNRFQRNKAMHYTAQAANGVNSLFLAKPVRREHSPDNIHNLLRDCLQLLVSRIGCL